MASHRKIIIGLGTPKSGTHSLARLFEIQEETFAAHENVSYLPWKPDYRLCYLNLAFLLTRPDRIVSDVAFYWLNYVEQLIKNFGDFIKFLCIKRNMTHVVRSTTYRTTFEKMPHKKIAFPDWYNSREPEDVTKYYSEYYYRANVLKNTYPHSFRLENVPQIFDNEIIQRDTLDWLGFDNPVIELGIHLNKTQWWKVGRE